MLGLGLGLLKTSLISVSNLFTYKFVRNYIDTTEKILEILQDQQGKRNLKWAKGIENNFKLLEKMLVIQPRCKVIAEWEHTKGIKKQDLRKKPLAHQRIVYKRILTLQTEDGIYDLEKRKILKHNEQWSIALEKARQYINQFIKEGNRRVVEAYTEIL
ncbi:unnamed protein product [Rhizophagus irregularis]|nr:unnamed protein product [Rhizophagus irregularis]